MIIWTYEEGEGEGEEETYTGVEDIAIEIDRILSWIEK